ncbi:MAG: 2-C-methyl-D-erythritol 2,4-cyclodiphosphate synthase [Candidatus Omnitrophica bacterium]|nr:2-C-methyl-D-erythritol 2,4-cyclodiphosphate synthase [Candidatus Omnitrophota bacterium]MBU1048007.1 2-C-methyl-D-erythritol 2,4-cyclodiphosphate synthase [Candidatus Omnitrophota bacterium]MBU1889377.1 2-C-methyl-D-erythritol 2,4-cyclodiphosphate synthase [Candidatus Omnitrophota bacterium]
MLIGLGYDIHKLQKGRKLILGGIQIPNSKGLLGHSDADVVTHCICDAILGAMGEKDIGEHFPDTDPEYKDIFSLKLLEKVLEIMKKKNLAVNNLDVTIIVQEPKVSPYREQIKESLNSIIKIPGNKINIKATSPEGLGALGNGEGIACISIVSLVDREHLPAKDWQAGKTESR